MSWIEGKPAPLAHRQLPSCNTVTKRVLDGPRSVVIAEARNRMLVQMAVLHQLLSGSWCGQL